MSAWPLAPPAAPSPPQTQAVLLQTDRLCVQFGAHMAVQDVSLQLQRGERLALVGLSGSGKSVTALALLGLNLGAQISGRILFQGQDLSQLSARQWQRYRGARIGMVFQEPMTALNPLMPIGQQIAEVLSLHKGLAPQAARTAAIAALEEVQMSAAATHAQSYPHQLSGGQRQRVLLAMALAAEPELLLADEPTTALDVHLRRQVLTLLEQLCLARGLAVIFISHDLHLVRHFADRIAVMEAGRIVETGPVTSVLHSPQHRCTQQLLAARLQRRVLEADAATVPPTQDAAVSPVLSAQHLCVRYPKRVPGLRGWWHQDYFLAVQDVHFALRLGQTLGIIGESGSGKTTLALAVLQLLPKSSISGSLHPVVDRAMRQKVQVVFQDPWSSLSPRMTVEALVGEGLLVHARHLSHAQRRSRVLQALADVGLHTASFPGLLQRQAHEFSGGQRQRIALARALVVEPQVLVLDEPTSALDASIQQQMVDLLVTLQHQRGLSYLLITHDVTVVQAMAHQVLVMRHSRVVESGPALQVLQQPQHDYTRMLVSETLA